MNTLRDTHLRLEARKQNWLRLEQLRRTCAAFTLLHRALLRSLYRDSGVSRRQRARVRRRLSLFSRASLVTRHSTRCRVTGRARQAFRDVQLARMQARQQMAEGRLLAFRLGRS